VTDDNAEREDEAPEAADAAADGNDSPETREAAETADAPDAAAAPEPAETEAPEAAEAAAAEAPAADETAATPEAPEADRAPAADEAAAPAETVEAAQAAETPETAAPPEAAPDAPASPEPVEQPQRSAPKEKGDKDVVPGANLEPIAITEERELTAEQKAALEAEEEERASREAAAARDDDDETPRRAAVAVPTDASIQATGKRKNSVARVILRAGGGEIEINGRSLDDYFPRAHHQSIARQPLLTAGYDDTLDVKIRVHGGGITGQAGAVRHGIARALCELDPELRGDLKRRGMLTRDARQKERRKAGLKKARKRPQFSKR
jgi:small subunit ribosomal protein S9